MCTESNTVSVERLVTIMDVVDPIGGSSDGCVIYAPKTGYVITVDGDLVYRIDVYADGGAWVYKSGGEVRAMKRIKGVSIYQYMGDLSDLM